MPLRREQMNSEDKKWKSTVIYSDVYNFNHFGFE